MLRSLSLAISESLWSTKPTVRQPFRTPRVIWPTHSMLSCWSSGSLLTGRKWRERFGMTLPKVRVWTNLVWGLLNQFPPFRYFPNFHPCQNTGYPLNITFIFDRCRQQLSFRYESDSKNWTDFSAKSNKGAFCISTPWSYWQAYVRHNTMKT